MIKIGEGIQQRLVAIEDGQKGAALFGEDRKGGGGLDLQGGADDNKGSGKKKTSRHSLILVANVSSVIV